MRVSEIKAELSKLKVDYKGLFEKSEFVAALIKARREKAPPAEVDDDVVEGKTKKMLKKDLGGASQGMLGGMGRMPGMRGAEWAACRTEWAVSETS